MDMPTELKQRWATYKQQHPNTRIRNAAKDMGVSEAELVATSCGDTVERLEGDWADLINRLPELGEILCITRNDLAVHEKVGAFGNVSVGPGHGIVLNRDIDLRLFMSHWHHGFAVEEETKNGQRLSLQFFDIDGTSVHKVYLRDASNRQAYEAIISDFVSADQSTDLKVLPLPRDPAERPDGDIDVDGMRSHWRALQDTHDFVELLRTFDVRRKQSLRLAGTDLAYRLPVASFRDALQTAARDKVSIMIFVGNKGCIQIHTGPVENIVDAHGWLNILDPGFDLHVKLDQISEAWVVRKPTRDGIVTSVELYDAQSKEVLYMFGERKPGEPERADWQDVVAGLPAL